MQTPTLALRTRPLVSRLCQPCTHRRYLAQDTLPREANSSGAPPIILDQSTQSPATTMTRAAPRDARSTEPESYAAMRKLVLPHKIPSQYLMYIDQRALNEREREERQHLYQWALPGHASKRFKSKPTTDNLIKGVVVSAGKMDKTVKVRIPGQRFDKHVKKHFASYTNHLTHDPNNSLREGDVVVLHKLRISKTVRHVVAAIEVPFGTPIEERAPIPTPEQRLQAYKEKRIQRLDVRMTRVRAAAGSGIAQRELLEHKLQKNQQLTEATIQQAEAYARIWMKRHGHMKPPRLRKVVIPRKTAKQRKAERVAKDDPAWNNVQGAKALKDMAAQNMRNAQEKEAQLSDRGLQAPDST